MEPERLRRQFPGVEEDDLQAYAEVTRRILGEARPADRARLTREILARGRQARDKATGGGSLTAEEAVALRYLRALEKMQGRTSAPSKG